MMSAGAAFVALVIVAIAITIAIAIGLVVLLDLQDRDLEVQIDTSQRVVEIARDHVAVGLDNGQHAFSHIGLERDRGSWLAVEILRKHAARQTLQQALVPDAVSLVRR